ncbi:T9SS type A sorting domain-containing protein [Flavobacteriales bacterium AH-315-E23]|nr:T9SS type A sorting domain-containing protein [Flavobacteriales bacterium AH-315-E23]
MKITRALTTVIVVLALFGISLMGGTANAQCTPDFSCTTDLCPDVGAGLPDGTVGVLYSEVITVVIPLDSSGFTVDSVVLVSINNLPPGLSYTCTPPSCSWPGNSFGCFVISGIPSDTGTYDLVLNFIYYLALAGQVNDAINYNSITINGGCSVQSSFTSNPTLVCEGDTVNFTNTSSGATSYNWLEDGNSFATTSNASRIFGTAGSYTISLVADSSSCSDTSSIVITVNSPPGIPTITASGPTTFCQGDSVILTVSGVDLTWTWSTGGPMTLSIIVSTGGSYTVTTTDINNCSSTSLATTVTVDPAPAIPSITASGPTTFCVGDSVILTSSAATSYSWSSGQSTQSITVSTSGSYTVTITDSTGCSATSAATTVTVTTSSTPTVTASGPTTFCQGDDVILVSSTAATYLWSTGETTQSITVSTSGSFTVSVVDSTGCSGTSSATTVTVTAAPVIDLITSTDATSCGASDGTINISASGGTAPLQYSIDGGATFFTTNGFSALAVGNYDVVVSDAIGCMVTGSTETITAPGAPTTTAGADAAICEGDTYTLQGAMGGTASSITWSTSGTGTFDDPTLLTAAYTPSAADISAGSVTLTITTDDPDGGGACQAATDDIVLTFTSPTPPTITQSGNTLMSSGAVTYQWFFNGDTIAGETGQFYTATQTGFYSVAITDVDGCLATSAALNFTVGINENLAYHQIKIYPNPNSGEFTLEVNDIGELKSAQIKITNVIGQVVYWEDINQNSGAFQMTVDLGGYTAGLYTLQLLSGNEILISKKIILEK